MWYVIQTLKGRESRVLDGVVRDVAVEGEKVFIFENEMEYKVKGDWIKNRKPFFPGYVFAEMDKDRAEDFDRRLRKKLHPLKLIAMDGKITPITDEEQDYLMRLGGDEHIIRHSEGFRVDDLVEITAGSFKGFKGEIRKLDRHNRRARIRMSLMGIETEVTIGLEIVSNITFQELGAEGKIDRLNMARIVRN